MKLHDYLRSEGIKAPKFAKLVGLRSKTAVYDYLHGRKNPSKKTMAAIKKVTDGKVTANDFHD